MSRDDPHIHVESKAVHGRAAARTILASAFGLVGDLPSEVTTGCGLRVPYAMTSSQPEKVTCLACREHARVEHLRAAEAVEGMGRMPGSTISPLQATQAADRHRELAARFSDAES
ncbi:hypothetical protein [Streptomyces cellulosae]|uniref:Uncharacterized protein n=1 Tax=Streptomyces cellulosae TaxID=1968 RepID=A0ABW7Y0A1_STRCE